MDKKHNYFFRIAKILKIFQNIHNYPYICFFYFAHYQKII